MVGNRLGLSSGAFWPHFGTDAVPELAARLGVRDVEVMLQDAGEYRPAFVQSLRRTFDAAGIAVQSVHLKQKLHLVLSDDPAVVAEAWALFDDGIAAATGLGAGLLVWHGPSRREPGMPGRMAAFPEAATELARRCRRAGIVLTLENVSYCALPSVRDVRHFSDWLSAAGLDDVGFTFDPFQAAEADANLFMMLSVMGERLRNVHLSDYGSGGSRHLAPGDGELPWPALLRAIAHRYDGPLLLETPLGPEPDAPFARIRAMLDPLIAAASDDPVALGGLPPGVREGVSLFNAGAYYEAHEVIEYEWHAEPAPVRRLYQGILQVGIGIHHARNGNRVGALRKLSDGLDNLSPFPPDAGGIDVGRFVREATRFRAAVETADAAGLPLLTPPAIHPARTDAVDAPDASSPMGRTGAVGDGGRRE